MKTLHSMTLLRFAHSLRATTQFSIYLALITFMSLTWTACDDETNFGKGGTPEISVDPNPISLTAVPVGQSTTRVVNIKMWATVNFAL